MTVALKTEDGGQIWCAHQVPCLSHALRDIVFSFSTGFPPGAPFVSDYVSLVRCNLKQNSLALFRDPWWHWHFWKAQVGYFIDCFSVLACLMFPGDLIQITHVQMEYHTSNAVSFWRPHLEATWCHHLLLIGYVNPDYPVRAFFFFPDCGVSIFLPVATSSLWGNTLRPYICSAHPQTFPPGFGFLVDAVPSTELPEGA